LAPQRYDKGINMLSLGQNKRIHQEIVENCTSTGDEVLVLVIARRKVRERSLAEQLHFKRAS